MAFPLVLQNGNLADAGRKSVMDNSDDLADSAPRRPAARRFRLRQGDHRLAAQQQSFDPGPPNPAAVTTMKPAVAIAGLAAPLLLKPQNRPRFRIHSNHQIRPPSPKGAFITAGILRRP